MKKFFYRVNMGDSVISLSNRFNMPTGILISENGLFEEIEEGDILYIESFDSVYKVMPNEREEDIAEKFNISTTELLGKNRLPYVYYGIVLIT